MELVAPRASPAITRLARRNKIKYRERPFRDSDVRGRTLVFCATDDEVLNRRVGRLCARRGILVNVADRPEQCDFVMPAVARRGGVVFAVSTGGASPALARFLRDEILRRFGREVGVLARKLGKIRGGLLRLPMARRSRLLRRVIDDRSLSALREGRGKTIDVELGKILREVKDGKL